MLTTQGVLVVSKVVFAVRERSGLLNECHDGVTLLAMVTEPDDDAGG